MKVHVEGTYVVVELPGGEKVRESSVTALLMYDLWRQKLGEDRNAELVKKIKGRIVAARREGVGE